MVHLLSLVPLVKCRAMTQILEIVCIIQAMDMVVDMAMDMESHRKEEKLCNSNGES